MSSNVCQLFKNPNLAKFLAFSAIVRRCYPSPSPSPLLCNAGALTHAAPTREDIRRPNYAPCTRLLVDQNWRASSAELPRHQEDLEIYRFMIYYLLLMSSIRQWFMLYRWLDNINDAPVSFYSRCNAIEISISPTCYPQCKLIKGNRWRGAPGNYFGAT